MQCKFCSRPISGDLETRKRVEYRRWPDQSVHVYGLQMADGPLSEARGKLVSAAHAKCYFADARRRERAPADGAAQDSPAERRSDGTPGNPAHRGT